MKQSLLRALTAASEPLRAPILAFVSVLLRETIPALQEIPIEALLAPIIGYMIAKGLQSIGTGPGNA